MKKIKLFLASSEELKAEREQIEILVYRKNKEWIDKGIFLDLQIWENFLDAMSRTRLQDEYNNAIRTSDIFIMLYFSKVGKYTKEEFVTAYNQFENTNRPLIFTYFKVAPLSSGEITKEFNSLLEFQEQIKELGHFYTKYKSVEDLKFQISGQLDKLEENGALIEEIQDSKIETSPQEIQKSEIIRDFVDRHLTQRLEDALQSYSNLPKIWIEPILNKLPEASSTNTLNVHPNPNIDLSQFLKQPKSTIIKAPPLFGSTCLAHHLCREAWRKHNSYWMYLDSKQINHHSFKKLIEKENQILGFRTEDIKCIVLDSWSNLDKDYELLLEKISTEFSDIPIIVMQSIDETQHLFHTDISTITRKFDTLYLWTLSRGHIRKLISRYNEITLVGETDMVLSRLISDLITFNLPRTPLNCLTLLKAFEADFDESPINRYELINRVLFLLFNAVDIPTYKNKPDLKDCEYVLGYFCETLIRENKFTFTRKSFLEKVQAFCDDKIIDLDVQVVFDVLHINNILIARGDSFCFRFTYWIFYFSAKRMHHEPEFANYILQDMRYVSYPEIIEFYTGIDRKREDALKVLIDDIQDLCNTVEQKCGFPQGLNPYKYAQWKPSQESIEKMRDELNKGVKESNLPDFIKDQYADSTYDKSRPYHQEIQKVLTEYSLLGLWYGIKAGSRALRNSDYANPELKRSLLQVIMRSWEQVEKVLFTISPILALSESAEFEGTNFILSGDFGETPDERLNRILINIPPNVHSWYQDDLYSRKMGSLIIDRLNYENSEMVNHNLHLLIISQRPRGWENLVRKYIVSNSKNSFYLMDTHRALQSQYKYSFASYRSLETIKSLIKMTVSKHQFGVKNPKQKHIKKISDNVVEKRSEELD